MTRPNDRKMTKKIDKIIISRILSLWLTKFFLTLAPPWTNVLLLWFKWFPRPWIEKLCSELTLDSFEAMVHPRLEAQKSYVKSNDLPSCLCTMSNHSLWPWKPPRYKLVLGPASPSTQHLSSGGYALEEVEAGWHPNIARPLEKWEYHSEREREIYIYI